MQTVWLEVIPSRIRYFSKVQFVDNDTVVAFGTKAIGNLYDEGKTGFKKAYCLQ